MLDIVKHYIFGHKENNHGMKQEKTDLKITIDQLKNYLGTGLEVMRFSYGSSSWNKYPLYTFHLDDTDENENIYNVKPICYRLSGLDKFIPELGLVPLDNLSPYSRSVLNQYIGRQAIEMFRFSDFQKLFQWHFWPFGEAYFEQGLVIDKMKL